MRRRLPLIKKTNTNNDEKTTISNHTALGPDASGKEVDAR